MLKNQQDSEDIIQNVLADIFYKWDSVVDYFSKSLLV